MLAALVLTLLAAVLLAYFAKSVLIRTPAHSPESIAYASTSGLSLDQQPQLLRKRTQPNQAPEKDKPDSASETKSVMQPPRTDLAPPKDNSFTVEQLKHFDGTDPSKPIYVAIKATVFDVTRKADTYGKGKSYNLFAGKDASRALGMSSLKSEDAVSDYSTLSDADMKTLNDWYDFFSKRYDVVGKVIDLPPQGQSSL
ncbi:cytochrome b5-like heme/steroid binding domain-containing protein [Ganoderma leucocontextum]|nr:cytochrome b5-like heme/steroid binding domain-containing protein [Ganoderma leucocontextum]